jgi:aquaporin Z
MRVGHLSGGHFNPAITLGLAAARRFEWKEAGPYVVTQVLAAIAASATLWVIAINHKGTTKASLAAAGFAANGYGDHSPGQYNLFAGLVIEIVLTAVFLVVIMGTTDKQASKGFAALAIGLALKLIHLVSIPVTNTSVNPARSTGPAILLAFGGESWGLEQLWLFWLAPIVGGVLGAFAYQIVSERDTVSDAAVMGVPPAARRTSRAHRDNRVERAGCSTIQTPDSTAFAWSAVGELVESFAVARVRSAHELFLRSVLPRPRALPAGTGRSACARRAASVRRPRLPHRPS